MKSVDFLSRFSSFERIFQLESFRSKRDSPFMIHYLRFLHQEGSSEALSLQGNVQLAKCTADWG